MHSIPTSCCICALTCAAVAFSLSGSLPRDPKYNLHVPFICGDEVWLSVLHEPTVSDVILLMLNALLLVLLGLDAMILVLLVLDALVSIRLTHTHTFTHTCYRPKHHGDDNIARGRMKYDSACTFCFGASVFDSALLKT